MPRKATFDRTDGFIRLLEAALGEGRVTLGVLRAGVRRDVDLTGEPGCGGRFALLYKKQLNAWSDGTFVGVTERMMRFAPEDDQLAFVIAHEMAHNILHYGDKGLASRALLPSLAVVQSRSEERQADALGLMILASADYDLTAPRRLLARTPGKALMLLSLTHPSVSRRVAALELLAPQIRPAQVGPGSLLHGPSGLAAMIPAGIELGITARWRAAAGLVGDLRLDLADLRFTPGMHTRPPATAAAWQLPMIAQAAASRLPGRIALTPGGGERSGRQAPLEGLLTPRLTGPTGSLPAAATLAPLAEPSPLRRVAHADGLALPAHTATSPLALLRR